MSVLGAIIARDLRAESRRWQLLPPMVALSLVLVGVFALTASPEALRSPQTAAAVVALALTFAALLAGEQSFASERESHTLAALLAAPVDRRTLFLAKCAVTLLLVMVVELATLPVTALVFGSAFGGPAWALALVVLLTDVALATLATLAGAMLASARTRGPLLTVIVLPLLAPVLLSGVGCVAELAEAGWTERAGHLLALLAAFDLMLAPAAWLLSPEVIDA